MGQQLVKQIRPRGIVTDLPGEFVAEDKWTFASNVIFRDEITKRSPGFNQVFGTLNDPPEFLVFAPTGETDYWLYAGNTDLNVTDGTNHFDITPVNWVNPAAFNNPYTGGTLNTLAFLNDGVNAPVSWDGNTANIATELPDWPAGVTAGAMVAYKFHLFALNIKGAGGLDEDLLQWSDAAAPGQVPQSWTPGPGSQAGNNVIGDVTGALVDARVLRDDLIIYKSGSTHLAQFVGGAAVFAFRTLFPTTGLLARNAVVEVKGQHYLLSDGDIVRHDGQTVESIADSAIRKAVFDLLDPVNFDLSFAVYNDVVDEVLFCFPAVGATSCNIAAVYSPKDNQWGLRDIPEVRHAQRGVFALPAVGVDETWDADSQVWNLDQTLWNQATLGSALTAVLMASADNDKVYNLDADVTADGATISAVVSRDSMDLGDPTTVKLVTRIWPKIKANPGTILNVRVGGQIDLKDAIAFSPSQPFRVDLDISVPVTVTGKFISVEFSSSQDQLWELTGYDLDYTEAGKF